MQLRPESAATGTAVCVVTERLPMPDKTGGHFPTANSKWPPFAGTLDRPTG